MSQKKGAHGHSALRRGLKVALGTFIMACLLNANSQFLLTGSGPPILTFLLLLAVIGVGILFDIIGVAVAVADETPFQSRASRKMAGAQQAIDLIRKADKVSNFCCDVVGDICGTLSGGIGASIVASLVLSGKNSGWIASALMAGVVAALTVGGKAMSKTYSINQSDKITYRVGVTMAWFKGLWHGFPKRGKKNEQGKDK